MKCGLALTEPGTQNDEAIKAEARALRKRTSLLLLLTVLLLLLLFFWKHWKMDFKSKR